MTVVFVISFVMAFVFTCVCFRLFGKLNDTEERITLLEVKANYCEQSEKTLRESVDLQTKCIRDLNDIVKKSVENKEPTEPDTKALLGGWVVEESELSSKQPQQIDRYRMSKLVNCLHYKNVSPSIAELYQVLGPYGFREEIMNEKIFS